MSKHLDFLRGLPCCSCRSMGAQAAHIRIGSHAGIAEKPKDWEAVPLCLKCHALQHQIGEKSFWKNIDAARFLAMELYKDTGKKMRAFRHLADFYNG